MNIATYIANAKAITEKQDSFEALRLCRNLAKETPSLEILYFCKNHGDWNAAKVSGCPECVREYRAILKGIQHHA